MKNILIEELTYGEEKTVKLKGNYIKTLARAVEGGKTIANAEILLMTDDSEKTTEIRLFYADCGSMSEYIFFNVNEYCQNNTGLIDLIHFNYVHGEQYKTGIIIIVEKEATINS